MSPRAPTRDTWDPLHNVADPDVYWTTGNVGEALPGVLTPLTWTIWHAAETMAREMGYRMGAFSRRERVVPAEHERFIQVFYGRVAMQAGYLGALGDRNAGHLGGGGPVLDRR